MTQESRPSLTYLGRSTPAPTTPDEAVLDRVPNTHVDTPFAVRFSAPEFTVLCAVTGQPDFAHFIIDYVPRAWLIESKSLKFYLASFRNHSGFHEECTVAIGKRIAGLFAHGWLLVPARRNSDRCVLGGRFLPGRNVVARPRDNRLSGAIA
jgi:7-cyano-7-deazaguanine reductase